LNKAITVDEIYAETQVLI